MSVAKFVRLSVLGRRASQQWCYFAGLRTTLKLLVLLGVPPLPFFLGRSLIRTVYVALRVLARFRAWRPAELSLARNLGTRAGELSKSDPAKVSDPRILPLARTVAVMVQLRRTVPVEQEKDSGPITKRPLDGTLIGPSL